jgi:LacI family transcriptional regulator, galactose operon repressor
LATLIVDHLAKLKHRRIGIISGFMPSEWQRERIHWLREECVRLRLEVPDDWIVEGPISFDTGRNGINVLTAGRQWPTAIICGHDIIAVGAIAACQERGIAIPKDLSLTGFEDLELASSVIPPLTTVHFPAGELGARAGEEILKRIQSPPIEAQIELPIRLVVRGTTGRPSASSAFTWKRTRTATEKATST